MNVTSEKMINKLIKFDISFWIARIFPAILSLVPFYIFQYYYFNNLFFLKLKILENYSILFHSLTIVISLYLASSITRASGKDLIENIYFVKNNKLPTTQILVGRKKVISNQSLTNLKSKIKSDFNIDLNSRGGERILRINDAVNNIRSKVGYNHKILNQYNIEYGFFRNLTGGFVIYVPITLLLIFLSYSNNLHIYYLGLVIFFTELVFLGFSWKILDSYGTKYAKQLFSLYLAGVKNGNN